MVAGAKLQLGGGRRESADYPRAACRHAIVCPLGNEVGKAANRLYLIVLGLMLSLAACTDLAGVLCRLAGHCPSAPDGINKDH